MSRRDAEFKNARPSWSQRGPLGRIASSLGRSQVDYPVLFQMVLASCHFLVIFLKPAIRLSSALTPFLQSHTQNMSREAMPVDTVCGLGSQPRRAVLGVSLLSLASTAWVSCSLVPATGPRACVSSHDKLIEPVLTRRA